MKFLIIQENGRHDANRHMRECFCMQRALHKHGQECDVWGLGHSNFNTAVDYESYDVIINLENYDTGWVPSLSNTVKPLKLLWAIDAHFQGIGHYLNIFNTGKYHKILQATKTFVDMNSIWFPNCYDDTVIYPIPDVGKQSFIGFCGNYVNRKPLLDSLQSRIPGFQVAVGVLGTKMLETISSWHIHFNANVNGDINYRSFETLGCKSVLLTNKDYQYDLLGFKHGENCLIYGSIDEAVAIAENYRNKTNELQAIAEAGYAFVKSKHTYNVRAEELLNLIPSIYGQ